MKVGLYAGSFNPWHKGHEDILNKALEVFDRVVILQALNPLKLVSPMEINDKWFTQYGEKVETVQWFGLLKDYVSSNPEITALVRGLRNSADFEYEKSMQYVNEALELKIPTVYFVCDKSLVHYSSSAIRQLQNFGEYDVL